MSTIIFICLIAYAIALLVIELGGGGGRPAI